MRVLKTSLDLDSDEVSAETILLGTWCFNSDPDVINNIKKSRILPYHWDDKDKLKKDYTFLEDIYEKKLLDCAYSLNKIHNTEKDIRYWRILIGPWLKIFIDSIFDRYECIRMAHDIDDCFLFTVHDYSDDLSAVDFHDFYEKLTSDLWNEIIFSECIKAQNISYQRSSKNLKFNVVSSIKKTKANYYLTKLIYFYQYLISRFKRKIAIISPYIQHSQSIKLQLSLKSLPFIISPELIHRLKEVDNNKRKQLIFQKTDTDSCFESFLNIQIQKNIPKAYIESYAQLRHQALRLLPIKTEVIYTANGYQSNEAFKFWAAENCYLGSKLIIGQHGGTFGLSYFHQAEVHQLKIADQFISWGWTSNKYKNIKPLPSINLEFNKTINTSQANQGPIIHVLGCLPRYFYHFFSMPFGGQFANSLEDQITFLNSLTKDNLNKVQIRQDVSSKKWGWNIEGILCNHGFANNISNSILPIKKQLKGASICICTHNGTVPLETLALNFPTIIFWNLDNYEIRPEAIESIQILKKAGIFFDCPKLAAQQINIISDDVASWWQDEDIQTARLLFVDKYALTSKNPVFSLKDFLIEESRS